MKKNLVSALMLMAILGSYVMAASLTTLNVSTQPICLPIWKIGQSWTYKNFYVLPVHKWLNLKDSEIQKVRYTVIGARPLNLAYEYILFTEYFTKNTGIIPDFQYAPVSNLSIMPIEGPNASYLDFPLYVGKKWKILLPQIPYLGSLQEIKKIKETFPISANVQSTETVVTPAGTFTSYKINYKQNDGITFNLWYSPEVENILEWQKALSVLINFSKMTSEELKNHILQVVEKMPKSLLEQRTYVILSLYRFGILNLNESMDLISGVENH